MKKHPDIENCPRCHYGVYGTYSAVPPFEWFWGDYDNYIDWKFCPNCGKKLPNYGINPNPPNVDWMNQPSGPWHGGSASA